jgi:hypothetical protein
LHNTNCRREGFLSFIHSPGILCGLIEKAHLVAASSTSVLLLGESGTGKELIARAIHKASSRATKLFIARNCGAIAESLVESELFGSEKGAFTGAISRRPGWFEQADGGTLFLDEVGELAVPIQVKLLRALQERCFQRLGGNTDVEVDVRVICSTSRDLDQMILSGTFRADLYYRISAFPMQLPPLRDRRDDIPFLIHHFIDKLTRQSELLRANVSADVEGLLTAYSWPGNVRESENAIEYALVLAGGSEIMPQMLPTKIGACPTTTSRLAELAGRDVPIGDVLNEFSFAPALAVPRVASSCGVWLEQVRPPEVLIVDDFRPNLEIYEAAAAFLGTQMSNSLGQAVEGIRVTVVHPDELEKDIPALARRLRTCVLLVLDLHFDDGVKSWINGYELLAYAVEAAPWLGGTVLFVTQTGHNPQRSVYYTQACEAIRELAEFGDASVRLLRQIEPEVYPIEIDGGQRRVVPSFGEHSDPAHRQWWWGLSWTMEKLLRNRLNAMESWLNGKEQLARTPRPDAGRETGMSSVAGDIGVTASGTNSVSPTRQRDSFEGPLHVSDAVQWIAAKIKTGSRTYAILKAFRAAWNMHEVELRPVLFNANWKTELFDELAQTLMDKEMQRSRGTSGPADADEIKQRARDGWKLWCKSAGIDR